jgi:ribonuclease P/MRP protein subunit RPP1
MGLVRATRGRSLLLSSEARRTADIRGPYDVINLATFWGMKQEFGMGDGRKVVLHSEARRLTYKGAVQVMSKDVKEIEKLEEERPKRKVEPVDEEIVVGAEKREKRRKVKKKKR